MKKISFILCLMLAFAGIVKAGSYNYLCGVTAVTVTDQSSKYVYGTDTSFVYLVQITQTCKNTAEYKSTTTYASTVDLYLNPETHRLEGTYSTADYSICSSFFGTTTVYYSSYKRTLNADSTSTFTITKIDDTHYSIGEGVLHVQNSNKSNIYAYNYCYNAAEIGTKDIGQTPFVFEYDPADKTVEITPSGVEVTPTSTGFTLEVAGTDAKSNAYTATIYLESENINGEFSVDAKNLSTWTSVTRATTTSYIKATGTTVTITPKTAGTYTLSANLVCENGFTYILNSYDFTYENPSTSVLTTEANNTRCRKFMRNGQIFIQKGDAVVNILGVQQ